MTNVDFFEGFVETFAGSSPWSPTEPSLVEADIFRESMARVCAPVTIVTTLTGEGPYGTTVSAFCSLSLEPPMVIVSLGKSSNLLASIRSAGRLSVNVLAADQQDLAMAFGRRGGDKFAGIAWTVREALPYLEGAATWLGCTLDRLVDGGDHIVVLAAVTHAEVTDRLPLVYARQTFGTHDALARRGRCG